MYQQLNNPPPFPSQSPSSSSNDIGRIEMMFEQMMKKNADLDAQLVSHNTSIRNLEVQLGQISQSLNILPKGAQLSDTVVNPKSGNNHVIVVTTRSGRGGDVNASKQKQILDDDVELQEDEVPLVVEDTVDKNVNKEVSIDIQDIEVETQNDVNPSREHIIDMPEPAVPKAKAPLPRSPPPYSQRLAKTKSENQFKKFIDMIKSLSINMPLVEDLEQMLGYAKFMKDLVTKKCFIDCETIKMTHQPRLTSMRLQMEDRTMKRPLGIIDDVLVRVDKFILSADFAILDCKLDYDVPIILGSPFLATGKALVDVEAGEFTFRPIFVWSSLMNLINSDSMPTRSFLYKDKMKYLHDKYARGKEFKVRDLVLFFNSRLRLFPGKIKSKWSGPFEVMCVTPFGALDLKNKNEDESLLMAKMEMGEEVRP
ncbi:uncharacterized protein [Nicotiana sylvestris]|uniref:uncharacterized protein n=1 Tax=Nicotiana sylvestris TaxID=4096 RepID=UPI00388C8AB1